MTSEILNILDKSYPELPVPLNHRNTFELLIAVILSAQCTDKRVNTVTPHLFPKDRACTPQDILDLGESEVKRIIYPCGYYNSKTKALMGSAEMLQKRADEMGAFGTNNRSKTKHFFEYVPSRFEELRKLPGVGAKTAQVVQAQAFDMPAFPVDTHVHRVCNRIGLADSGKNRDKTERQVKAIVPKDQWSDLHLQLIYHGRQVCTAYKPKCGHCPLFELCKWKEKENYL